MGGHPKVRFEAALPGMCDDLREMVSRESPSDDASRVTSLARFIRDVLRARGVDAQTRACPPRGDALLASVGGEGGTLVLGHLDTVWPVGSLAEIPFRIEGDRATGPGVFDMKAGIAVALTVLPALAIEPEPPPVTLLLVPDEEIGTDASRGLLLEVARRHRRVLVLEPSLDGAVQLERKGTGLFRLRFRGRAAHAGLEPENGASALAELARCVLFLETLADRSKETTVTPSVARSGERTNVVPDTATLSVDARVWSKDEAARLETSVRGYRPADPRVSVEVEVEFDRPPLELTPGSRALYEHARRIALDLGFDLLAARVGGASDGNLTAAAGVPTLDGLGPRGGGAHARDEFVWVSDLPRRAALLARLAAEDA
jgi:glutamate carboxypeptidase